MGEEAAGPPRGPTLCAPCQGRPHLPPLWGPSALVWESWLPSSPEPTDTGPSCRSSLCPHGSPRTKMGRSIILLPKADPAFLLSPCLVAFMQHCYVPRPAGRARRSEGNSVVPCKKFTPSCLGWGRGPAAWHVLVSAAATFLPRRGPRCQCDVNECELCPPPDTVAINNLSLDNSKIIGK